MKIFISYGHDENARIVKKIGEAIKALGHDVWIDKEKIKVGDSWRKSILEGIHSSDLMLSFLSKHSIRDPGVCRDEIRITLGVKGNIIRTILLEPGIEKEVPIHISHIQWLDLSDWEKSESNSNWFEEKIKNIKFIIENPELQDEKSDINFLRRKLKPSSFVYDLFKDTEKAALFTKRTWIDDAIKEWEKNGKSKLFWMLGGPGSGKTSFIADLVANNQHQVFGVNFCQFGSDERNAPDRVLRTLAFQIASRIPHYRRHLVGRLKNEDIESKNVTDLRNFLFTNAFAESHLGSSYDLCFVVIDALDEALASGHESLLSNINLLIKETPHWLRFLITSRPEAKILQEFSEYDPTRIDVDSKENRSDSESFIKKNLEKMKIEFTGEMVNSIFEASNGNYLYLDQFFSGTFSKEEILDLLNKKSLPKGLNAFYYSNFKKIFTDSESNVWEQVEPALSLIAAASSPVPEEVLLEVLDSKKGINLLKTKLNSYLKITEDKRIGFYHKSIRDWLTSDENAYFKLDIVSAAKELALNIWDNLREQEEVPTGAVADFYVGDFEDLILHFINNRKKTEFPIQQSECYVLVNNIKAILLQHSHETKFKFSNALLRVLLNSKMDERSRIKLGESLLRHFSQSKLEKLGAQIVRSIFFKNSKLTSEDVAIFVDSELETSLNSLVRKYCQLEFAIEFYESLKCINEDSEFKLGIDLIIAEMLKEKGDLEGFLKRSKDNLALVIKENHLNFVHEAFSKLSDANFCLGNIQASIQIQMERLSFAKDKMGSNDVLRAMESLAYAYEFAGKREEALVLYKERLESAKIESTTDEVIRAIRRLASAYIDAGKIEEAMSLYKERLEYAKEKSTPDEVLRAMKSLASAYTRAHKIEEAMSLYKERLEYAKEKSTPDDVLRSMGSLASAYEEAVKMDEALVLYKERIEYAKEKSTPDEVLEAMERLAFAYTRARKMEEALVLYKERLEYAKEKSTPDEVLRAMESLASAYEEAVKMDEAFVLYKERLEYAKEKSTPDEVLRAMESLASAYLDTGKIEEAISLCKERFEYAKEKSTPIHVLRAMGSLASAYTRAHEIEEAMSLYKERLEYAKEKSTPDDVLYAMERLASAYLDTDKIEEAISLYKERFEYAKEKSTPDEVLRAMGSLASAYLDTGKIEEAMSLCKERLEYAKEKSTPDEVLRAMESLASAYTRAHKMDEAFVLYKERLEYAKEKSTPDEVLRAMGSLAFAYTRARKMDEALVLYKERIEYAKEKSTPDEVLEAMKSLASAYEEADKMDEALVLYKEHLEYSKQKSTPDEVLRATKSLASAYTRARKMDEALVLYKERIEYAKEKSTPDDVLYAMESLASVYDDLGKEIEANNLRKEILILKQSQKDQ